MTTKLIQKNDLSFFRSPVNFDPELIFNCGQCFRFDRKTVDTTLDTPADTNASGNGVFCGVAKGRYIEVEKLGDDIIIRGADKDADGLWDDYFDMDTDYGAIGKSFEHDRVLCEAYKYGSGIRILHQDEFETLISFIISQNNNIPRIKGIIKNLCAAYGEPFEGFDGNTYHAFPTAEAIVRAGEQGMKELRMGFRAGYVYDAAKKVLDGEIDLKSVYGMDTKSALEYLMKIKGVGLKVASCTALFAFKKYDAFPVDVWVKRILEKYYNGEKDADYFGEYGGVAQQYLFYYERCMNGVML